MAQNAKTIADTTSKLGTSIQSHAHPSAPYPIIRLSPLSLIVGMDIEDVVKARWRKEEAFAFVGERGSLVTPGEGAVGLWALLAQSPLLFLLSKGCLEQGMPGGASAWEAWLLPYHRLLASGGVDRPVTPMRRGRARGGPREPRLPALSEGRSDLECRVSSRRPAHGGVSDGARRPAAYPRARARPASLAHRPYAPRLHRGDTSDALRAALPGCDPPQGGTYASHGHSPGRQLSFRNIRLTRFRENTSGDRQAEGRILRK